MCVMHIHAVCCYCWPKQTCTSAESCCTHVKHDLCQTINNSVAKLRFCHSDEFELRVGLGWVCLFSDTYMKTYVWVHRYLSTFTHFANFYLFQFFIKFRAIELKCERKAPSRKQCIFLNIFFYVIFVLWIMILIGQKLQFLIYTYRCL